MHANDTMYAEQNICEVNLQLLSYNVFTIYIVIPFNIMWICITLNIYLSDV